MQLDRLVCCFRNHLRAVVNDACALLRVAVLRLVAAAPHLTQTRSLALQLRALESEVVRLVMQNAGLVKKDVLLQDEFERLRALNEPGLLQLKQLIVEPAVNREFMRLASLAKTSSLEAHRLKDEVRGLHFASNNPKGPSSLLSQIKGLKIAAIDAGGVGKSWFAP